MCCRWRNTDVEEEGYDSKTGKVLVKVDPQYFRPAEVEWVTSRFLVPFGLLIDAPIQTSPRKPRKSRARAWLDPQSDL